MDLKFNINNRLKFLFIVLLILIFVSGFKVLFEKSLFLVWTHPETNICVMDYLAPTVKRIDYMLNVAKRKIGNDKYKISYLYKNYYGSGFIKDNNMPNDLDCSVGVYLGLVEYNGENINQISDFVSSKISVFYTAFYETAFQLSKDSSVYPVLDPSLIDNEEFLNYEINRKTFLLGIKNIFKNTNYVASLEKSPYDAPDMKVDIPFVMNSNEILVADLDPVFLIMDDVLYNSSMKNYAREVSFIFDFFVDVKNTKTNEVKRVEVVPESFLGERLQLSRRLYAPSVFGGVESFYYLKNYEYLNDKDLYLQNRIYNLKRYVDVIDFAFESDMMPVKILKRLHQTLDAFSPVLDEQSKKQSYAYLKEAFNNPSIICLNDIQNILSLMKLSSKNLRILQQVISSGQVSLWSKWFDENIKALENEKVISKKTIAALISYKNNLVKKMYAVKTQQDLNDLNMYIVSQSIVVLSDIKKCQYLVIDKDQLDKIDSLFKELFYSIGFRRVCVYWLDSSNIGIVKDETTKNVDINTIKNAALEANLPNINYSFINKDDLPNKIYAHSYLLLRIDHSKSSELKYKLFKEKLLEDKKKYNLKSKLIARLF